MNDEEAKELLGLCLIIAWLSLLKNCNFIHLGRLGVWIGGILTLVPFVSWFLVEILQEEMSGSVC
jgi:putative copper export protein